MNHIRVTTTQNITIDYDVAGIGERIAARLIDYALFLAIYFLFVIGMVLAGTSFEGKGIIVLIVIYAILFVFYDLFCETLFNGQSIGKKLVKIKVISLDGYQPSLGQYMLRWLFRFVDFVLTGQLAGLISVAVTDKKQRIGDIVAGTTLIKTVPRTSFDAVVLRPQVTDETYTPLVPEVVELRDEDITLVHEVIRQFHQSGNHMLVYKMAVKATETMQCSIPEDMNDLQFLEQIIKDYSYLTATTSSERKQR